MNPAASKRFEIWGVSIPASALKQEELRYLRELPPTLPTHEWVCGELDRVWHEAGLDNRRPVSQQPIGAYYEHPVWLMNGLYSAADPESVSHREAIAAYTASQSPAVVVDVGGGFAELARHVARAMDSAEVLVLEPFPSPVAQSRVQDCGNIRFIRELSGIEPDVLVAQDVLEHVEDPIGLAIELARVARADGTIIFANNFKPIIECHLPSTFHLKHTFALVMRAMGLRYLGPVPGAPHAGAFQVPRRIRPARARAVERISRRIHPMLESIAAVRRSLGRTAMNLLQR